MHGNVRVTAVLSGAGESQAAQPRPRMFGFTIHPPPLGSVKTSPEVAGCRLNKMSGALGLLDSQAGASGGAHKAGGAQSRSK